MRYFKFIGFLFILNISIIRLQAQTIKNNLKGDSSKTSQEDTTQKKGFLKSIIHYFNEAKKDKSQKKFDISFIAGPNYSKDTKFGIGMLGSGIYRIDKNDLSLSPSDVSLYANITTSGFFAVGIDGHTIFPEDKYRINYDTYFAYMPKNYFGIGYAAGRAGKATKFDEYTLSAKADFLRQIIENAYIGISLSAQHIKGKHFDKKDMIPTGDLNNTIVGAGFILSYDSRDFIPNPYQGVLLKYEQNFYPEALGSTHAFNRIKFTARTYKNIWKKGILAFDFNGIFNNGDVPWSMLSELGSSRQMRGYYSGQYRDRHQLNTQIELRQKIKNRHGFVVWAGVGAVFDAFHDLDWGQILTTYGIGYRWEFKHRVNIRLDFGVGRGQTGFYFNVNEAF